MPRFQGVRYDSPKLDSEGYLLGRSRAVHNPELHNENVSEHRKLSIVRGRLMVNYAIMQLLSVHNPTPYTRPRVK